MRVSDEDYVGKQRDGSKIICDKKVKKFTTLQLKQH